jgi:hypothetical protein
LGLAGGKFDVFFIIPDFDVAFSVDMFGNDDHKKFN